MTRFSVEGVDLYDNQGAGPSSRNSKRPRTFSPVPHQFVEDEEIQPVGEEREEDYEVNIEDEFEIENENGDDIVNSEDGDEEVEEEEDDQDEYGGNEGDQDQRVGSHTKGSVSKGVNKSGSICGTLDDLDVLDCPICSESLKVPVFQCDNGHIACNVCCIKVENKCPLCCLPIGYIRCRAIENIIKSVKVPCKSIQYGCKEQVSYGEKDDHEEKCLFAPCPCPIPLCNFIGSIKQISRHFRYKHSIVSMKFKYSCLFPVTLAKSEEFLVFQEENEGSLFILKNTIERLGNAVTVCCIEPISSRRRRGFTYNIFAKNEVDSLRLQYVTESALKPVSCPTGGFLIVPNGFFSSRQLKLSLCIKNY